MMYYNPSAKKLKNKPYACGCLLTAVLLLQGCGSWNGLDSYQQNSHIELTAEQKTIDAKVQDGMAYNRYYIDWAISQGLTVDSLNGRAFFSEAGNNPRYEDNLLVIAKEYDNLSMAARLLALGADPNKLALQDGRPAFAHWKQQVPFLRQAVQYGADSNMTYGDADITLLTEAITDEDLELTRFLLGQGVAVRPLDLEFARQMAAQKKTDKSEIIAALLADKAGESISSDLVSSVVLCALGEQAALFESIKLEQADISKILQTAVSFGQVEIVDRLLNDYPIEIDCQGDLLFSAAIRGDEQTVLFLLKKTAALQTAAFGVQAIKYAIQGDHAALVQTLLAQDWKGNLITADQARTTTSLLNTACEYGNPEIVDMITQAYTQNGPIPQERLCNAGVSILSKHNLHDAKSDNMRTLLECGADPNFEIVNDEDGAETLFYTAIMSQCTELTALMIDYHADTTKPLYQTPPICFAAMGLLPMLELFTQEDMNARDAAGMTPLMYAVRASELNAVDWLLLHGADTTLTDYSGKRAEDYALGDCADLILEKVSQ